MRGPSSSASAACAPECNALTSVRAVEDALKIKIPDNANIIRNLDARNGCMRRTTWCTSTTCTRSTGSTSSVR